MCCAACGMLAPRLSHGVAPRLVDAGQVGTRREARFLRRFAVEAAEEIAEAVRSTLVEAALAVVKAAPSEIARPSVLRCAAAGEETSERQQPARDLPLHRKAKPRATDGQLQPCSARAPRPSPISLCGGPPLLPARLPSTPLCPAGRGAASAHRHEQAARRARSVLHDFLCCHQGSSSDETAVDGGASFRSVLARGVAVDAASGSAASGLFGKYLIQYQPVPGMRNEM